MTVSNFGFITDDLCRENSAYKDAVLQTQSTQSAITGKITGPDWEQ